ncbi:hypothetical protein [Nocardia sp.]|uniref:hypothetical protein n=1 Tax=Nocardia sp. TaxID=1821 RepID=UPI00262A30F2|nr:hypothetical protein [Nocardia sp.]
MASAFDCNFEQIGDFLVGGHLRANHRCGSGLFVFVGRDLGHRIIDHSGDLRLQPLDFIIAALLCVGNRVPCSEVVAHCAGNGLLPLGGRGAALQTALA